MLFKEESDYLQFYIKERKGKGERGKEREGKRDEMR